MTASELNDALLAAHAAGDRAAIGVLYAKAAAREVDRDAQAFFLTQAYIFALEAGSAEAAALRENLVALGAER